MLRRRGRAGRTERLNRRDALALLLIDAIENQQIVAMGCDVAESLGVHPGMSSAHARSLLSGVEIIAERHTPREDAEALVRLARWAQRFSPITAPDPPDGFLIDIRGCAHLFGGEERLADRLAVALTGFGFPVRIAVAPTFTAARAVARFSKRDRSFLSEEALRTTLQPLPIAALGLDSNVQETLLEIGVQSIGDLLILPRKTLAQRFGAGLLRRLDQATGGASEVLEAIGPGRAFSTGHVFESPITALDILLALSERLLTDLTCDLRAQGLGVSTLDVTWRRLRMTPQVITLRLARPSSRTKHLWSLLRPRLERLHLGGGVEEVYVRAAQTDRLSDEQLSLWAEEAQEQSGAQAAAWGELLDRFGHRLGTGAVTRPVLVASHVPESSFRWENASDDRHRPDGRGAPTEPLRRRERPSRLFDFPEPVRVLALVPDGPPAQLIRRGETLNIVASAGPERIAMPWWTGEPESLRDYFRIQDERGHRLWVFRDRALGRWFLHGEWA